MSIKGIFAIDHWDFESRSIIEGLPPEDLMLLFQNKVDKQVRKREIIFREGGFPSGLFFIAKGKAKKFKLDKNGNEHIIYIANSGEFLGYHAVLAGEPYPDSAAALEDSLISFIAKEDFLSALEHSHVLNKRLLRTLSHEFGVLANSLAAFAQKSVRERLALQLVVLREKYKTGSSPGTAIAIDISREDLAGLVGTARENIVRTLSEFKKEGIVETRGRKIIVRQVKKLVAIADAKQ